MSELEFDAPTRWKRVFGPALALLLACGMISCPETEADIQSDLLLLYTATINGFIEPCGCVAGQIGGIDRMAGYIEAEQAAHPAALYVDGGDIVAEDLLLEKNVLEQLPLKAEAFFKTFESLGCEAVGLGEMDLLHLGAERLQELAERFSVPILCGNVANRQGELLFPESRIVERGGKRIGLFSLLAPKLNEAKAKDALPVDVVAQLRGRGMQLLSWRRRAAEIVADLAPRTDVIVCVSHLGFDLNQRLAQAQPEVDVILGGHFGAADADTNVVEETPVLVSFVRGSRVGRMEWWWPEEDKYFKDQGHGELLNATRWSLVPMNLRVATDELEDIYLREAEFGTELWQRKVEGKIAEKHIAEVALRNLPEIPNENRFAHTLVPMHRQLARNERALQATDTYHDELEELWTGLRAGERDAPGKQFPGPDKCQSCHPDQVEFWYATRHSFALSALETTNQHVDAECFMCHTVGYRQEGGFRRPGRHQGFENVQCAACHGPGAGHVSGGPSYFEQTLFEDGGSTCATCHNKEHDPKFPEQAWAKLARVSCPPLRSPELRNEPMLEAGRAAALVYAAQESIPWTKLIRSLRAANEVDAAVRASEQWYAENPERIAPAIVLAESLNSVGRGIEAVDALEKVIAKDPLNVRAWYAKGLALRETDSEAALQAALEAFSLDPTDSRRARLVIEIYMDQGRLGFAKENLLTMIEGNPSFYTDLEDLRLVLD